MAGVSRSTADWISGGAYPQDYNSANRTYIPELWAGKLVENWYKSSVIAAITSTEYEGLIKSYGDNVIIRTTPSISISDYAVGDALTYEVPADGSVELSIDKAKSWALSCDDIDKMQSDLNLMQIFTAAAAEDLKVAVDAHVLDEMLGDAIAANRGATAGAISGNINLGAPGAGAPVAVTEANVIEFILRMGQALDEQNAPETGRWLVIPSAMTALLKDSELKQAYLTGDSTSPMRNGKIGMIDRFTIYNSNNLPNGGDAGAGVAYGLGAGEFAIYAGVPSACAFAGQIVKNETLPNPDTFGELMRGLQVYGYQTVKPEGLVEGVVTLAHS